MSGILPKLVIFLVSAELSVGCTEVQKGRSIVTRTESGSSKDNKYQYDLFRGFEVENREIEKVLLVAIYRAPGSEQQIEIINASEISKSLREWQIGGQAYNAELSWNRVSDVVVSGSIPYNRRDGNVFLIVPNAFPELTLQLSGLRDEFELDQCLDELDARLKEK